MKITRKGNPKGIDIDYEVTDITTEEADELHKSLLKKGFLFTYSSKGVYEPPTENVILHYVDKDLKLYDYAILFTKQERPAAVKKQKDHTSALDLAYQRAKTDPDYAKELINFMRLKALLRAFGKHITLYGPLNKTYMTRFKKVLKELDGIPLPEVFTEETITQLAKDLSLLFL